MKNVLKNKSRKLKNVLKNKLKKVNNPLKLVGLLNTVCITAVNPLAVSVTLTRDLTTKIVECTTEIHAIEHRSNTITDLNQKCSLVDPKHLLTETVHLNV